MRSAVKELSVRNGLHEKFHSRCCAKRGPHRRVPQCSLGAPAFAHPLSSTDRFSDLAAIAVGEEPVRRGSIGAEAACETEWKFSCEAAGKNFPREMVCTKSSTRGAALSEALTAGCPNTPSARPRSPTLTVLQTDPRTYCSPRAAHLTQRSLRPL